MCPPRDDTSLMGLDPADLVSRSAISNPVFSTRRRFTEAMGFAWF